MATAAVVIADGSPATPWILGILVPIGLGILGTLWRIQGRMTAVETQVTPLWSALQKELSDTVHRPHKADAEADALIDDLVALRMTPKKTARLKELLRARADNPNEPQTERDRAEMFLFIMSRVVKQDAEMMADAKARETIIEDQSKIRNT